MHNDIIIQNIKLIDEKLTINDKKCPCTLDWYTNIHIIIMTSFYLTFINCCRIMVLTIEGSIARDRFY